MSRRLELLQWLGLVAGGAVWFGSHVAGFGVTQAECGAGGASWGISNDVWLAALLGGAGALVLGAEAASIAVFAQTRGAGFGDEPDRSVDRRVVRGHFFAAAAIAANALFLVVIVLDVLGSVVAPVCRQA
jgi:hypothetical protein